MRTITTAMAVAALLAAAPAQGARPPVDQVAKKMQAVYERTRDLKGKFKQVYTDTLYGNRRVSYGYLYVRKPGMMRWNYVQPEKKSFIADGETLWVWEPEDKQAFRNPLSTANLSTGLTFLLGKGELSEEFDISYADKKLGSPEDLVIKLTPKQPTAQFDHILLAVRPEDHVVTESMVVGQQSTNHFIFSKLRFNTDLGRWRFNFKPPEDARVIDGRQLRGRP